MIIVRLKGGMGNQMFQYAIGQQLAKRLKVDVEYDLTALLDRSRGSDFVYRNLDLDTFELNISTHQQERFLRALSRLKSGRITKYLRESMKKGRAYYLEPSFDFQEELLMAPVDNTVYEGWFQSYKYFEGIEKDLRLHFQFSQPILAQSKSLLHKIESQEAVCLNVRRTDFVSNANLNGIDSSYFTRAVDFIRDCVDKPFLFIFSDDIKWCEENLDFEIPYEVVKHVHKGYKFGNYMSLMSSCKHFIIPNSSFAWWAVWLNEYKDKIVVCPRKWFNDPTVSSEDLVPPEWNRI